MVHAAEHDLRRLASLMRLATEVDFDDTFGNLSTSEEPGHPDRRADASASWRSCSHARAGDELAEAPGGH